MWWNYLVACSSKHFSKVSPSFVVFDGTRRIPQPCRNFLMCMHACMYVCVDVCMDVCMGIWMEKLQIKKFGVKYVHNLGCFTARFMWSYSLGNITLRTSASWIWMITGGTPISGHLHNHPYAYIIIYTRTIIDIFRIPQRGISPTNQPFLRNINHNPLVN